MTPRCQHCWQSHSLHDTQSRRGGDLRRAAMEPCRYTLECVRSLSTLARSRSGHVSEEAVDDGLIVDF